MRGKLFTERHYVPGAHTGLFFAQVRCKLLPILIFLEKKTAKFDPYHLSASSIPVLVAPNCRRCVRKSCRLAVILAARYSASKIHVRNVKEGEAGRGQRESGWNEGRLRFQAWNHILPF